MSPLSVAISGRASQVNPRNGSASAIAAPSAWVIAHDLGAISPATMCRKVTSASATANATGARSDSGTPTRPKTGSSRCSIAGSATMPRPSEQSVMPSWAPASMRVSSRPLRTAVRAMARTSRPPRAAVSSRRCRRALTTANSAATNRPLATRSTTPSRIAVRVFIGPPLPGHGPARAGRVFDRSTIYRNSCCRNASWVCGALVLGWETGGWPFGRLSRPRA